MISGRWLSRIFTNFVHHVVDSVDTIKNELHGMFAKLEEEINKFADLEALPGSMAETSSSHAPLPGQHEPQSHWGSHHMQHGVNNTSSEKTVVGTVVTELGQLLNSLEEMLDNEGEVFKRAYETIKTQIVDERSTLSTGEIIKRLVGVIADVVVESADNILVGTLNVIEVIIEGVVAILDARIDIPVLSWIYEQITGSHLSILDLFCLVTAIPVNFICRMVFGIVPFPENTMTQSLLSAPDWKSLLSLIQNDINTESDTAQAMHMTSLTAEENRNKEIWAILLRVVIFFSMPVFVVLLAAKQFTPAEELSPDFPELFFMGFLVMTLPNYLASILSQQDTTWHGELAGILYGVTVLEKLADVILSHTPYYEGWKKASSVLDCLLGIACMVPAITPLTKNVTVVSTTACLTNFFWNANRVLSPFCVDVLSFGGRLALVALYGTGQLVLAVESTVYIIIDEVEG